MCSTRAVSATQYAQRYAQLKKSIATIGVIAEGSLVKRRITCGHPKCRCRKDPALRHGPYYQLTWKRKAKTISQFIPLSLVALYKQWIGNRQKMESIIEAMYKVSEKTIDLHLGAIENKKDKSVIRSVKKKLRLP